MNLPRRSVPLASWVRTRWGCPPSPRSSWPVTVGCRVLGVTMLTNMAAGILDQPLTEEEVLIAAEAGKAQFSALIRGCLRRLS